MIEIKQYIKSYFGIVAIDDLKTIVSVFLSRARNVFYPTFVKEYNEVFQLKK